MYRTRSAQGVAHGVALLWGFLLAEIFCFYLDRNFIARVSQGYRKCMGRVSEGYRKGMGRVSEGYRKGIGRVSEGYRKFIGPSSTSPRSRSRCSHLSRPQHCGPFTAVQVVLDLSYLPTFIPSLSLSLVPSSPMMKRVHSIMHGYACSESTSASMRHKAQCWPNKATP